MTSALLVVFSLGFAWRILRVENRRSGAGIPVVLTHLCSWQEALRQLGDDRQIVITYNGTNVKINEAVFTLETVGPELQKIFEYRNQKLFWFIADPKLNYGQVVRALAATRFTQQSADIIVPPRATSASVQVEPPIKSGGSIPLEYCPYPGS